jgi:hypothetical protein
MARRTRTRTSPDDVRPALPDDLAPALRERVENLLLQVPLARHRRAGVTRPRPARPARALHVVNRCVFCHRPGKLGGHHDERTGEVVWVHAKCHRRRHRAHRRTRRGDRWWQARVAALGTS